MTDFVADYNYIFIRRESPTKTENVGDIEETVWNDEVKKIFDEPVPVSVWEKYKLAVIEDDTEDITEEEMQNISLNDTFVKIILLLKGH